MKRLVEGVEDYNIIWFLVDRNHKNEKKKKKKRNT